MNRVWIVTEVDEFQMAVEICRVIGVYDTEDKAHMLAQSREITEPHCEFRVQGWPMNDSIE